MKQFRKFISFLVWTVLTLYIVIAVILHIPAVQSFVGSEVASLLGSKLGTKVTIGRVDVGFLNRIVIDDVHIYDQTGKPMIASSRMSATIDLISLFEGKIEVGSSQMFGADINFYKKDAQSQPNFQFALDSLASKDTTSHTPLDLRVNSLVIRNGKARWNNYSEPRHSGFDINHLSVSNLSTHIILNHLTDNSINATLKRLSLKEASGLDLRNLTFKFKADGKMAKVKDLNIELTKSKISFPIISVSYRKTASSIDKRSLRYNIVLGKSYIAPADLSFLEPSLRNFSNRINMHASIDGTANSINVKELFAESDDQSIRLRTRGRVSNLDSRPRWFVSVSPLRTSADGIKFIARNLRKHKIEIPDVVKRLGDIYYSGSAQGFGKSIAAKGTLKTSAGNVVIDAKYDDGKFNADIKSGKVNLRRILDNNDFGIVVADINARGVIPTPFKINKLVVKTIADVREFDYKGYPFKNINVDGSFANTTFDGLASINDPNAKITVKGKINPSRVLATLDARHVNLHNMKLTDALGNRTFGFTAKADLAGSNINNLNGNLEVNDFSAIGEGKRYVVHHLLANVKNKNRSRLADVSGDFGDLHIYGTYDYQSLGESVMSIAAHHLPGLFADRKRPQGNDFAVSGRLVDATLLNELFGIPLTVKGDVDIDGYVNDAANKINIYVSAPHIVYDGNNIKDVDLKINNNGDSLDMFVNGRRINDNGTPLTIAATASACDNGINLKGWWESGKQRQYYGDVNARANLFRNSKDGLGISLDILPSHETFDTINVAVQPSHLIYSHNLLDINHFEVSNGEQHVSINGQTTGNDEDSLLVDFRNINLKYVLDLVGFNSVEFTGIVNGKGYVKSFFSNPKAYAKFDVDDFRFQGGEFGTLHAKATYDNTNQRINIESVADDGPSCYTDINGYVSIKDNYINLPMKSHGTKMQFLEGFAGAVMENVKATGDGWCRVFGDLSHVNLEGDMICNGDIGIKQTKTTYTMKNSLIHMIPNEMQFTNDTVFDKDGNLGIVTGAIHHKELKDITFDIHVDAHDMLVLNRPDYDDNTFKGVIYATGKCDVIGRENGTMINANVTPNSKSYMEYNAGYTGSLDDNSFIHWNDVTPVDSDSVRYNMVVNGPKITDNEVPDIPGDLTMNIIVNTTPDFTLRVLMDPSTGDHMDFHGDGVIRATYFNKGTFQMFGNYNIDYGNYTMTIQNLVKKVFNFQQGSSISFGGNPLEANLNLKAQYTVNGVSLSDLRMGRSFTSNTIRVNCLMDIAGKPRKPTVTFDLDLPTLSEDARQMVKSVMNSEEDMNQQVLYLLAIGRFYNPGSNNAEIEDNASRSQTSLAMQSVLSGTISQQINNVLSTVIHNTNWNFGANIATGDEGWSNAEYEGLLSGRMLNNRLFFQGQFGYRDNVTTNNSSFIGDFDLRYLLTPNGNIAVRVYNETNDRYFTRNSLTTQGIGFIFKKDFNGWRDLFGIRKAKKSKKKH